MRLARQPLIWVFAFLIIFAGGFYYSSIGKERVIILPASENKTFEMRRKKGRTYLDLGHGMGAFGSPEYYEFKIKSGPWYRLEDYQTPVVVKLKSEGNWLVITRDINSEYFFYNFSGTSPCKKASIAIESLDIDDLVSNVEIGGLVDNYKAFISGKEAGGKLDVFRLLALKELSVNVPVVSDDFIRESKNKYPIVLELINNIILHSGRI